jgi:uncharacterized membrane protein
MTLLVVGITVPTLSDAESVKEMAEALSDRQSDVIAFFISFTVIGRYWLAHHDFVALLGAVDRSLIGINLVYLGFIAFLPFPTALLGIYFENPLSVVVYACAVGIVSGMEVVLFRHAYRSGLLRREMPEPVFRWGAMMSLAPLAFFALSIPIAFWSTTVAVASWFLVVPFSAWAVRRKPEGADEFFR